MHSGSRDNHARIKAIGLTVITLIILVSSFPLDVMLPSFASIAQYFSVDTKEIPLTVTIFALGFCISQLALGPLSDRHGRINILAFALAIAIIASIGCSSSSSFGFLLAWRFLQGIGCGCFVLANALIQDCIDADSRQKTRIWLTTVGGVFISISPLAGSILESHVGWRGSFFVFAVLSTATMLIVIKNRKIFPPQILANPQKPSNIASDYYSIFKNAVFVRSWLICALGFTCHFSFIVLSPLIFIETFHISNTTFSYLLLTYGLAYIVGGFVANNIAGKISIDLQIYIGSLSILIGGLLIIMQSNPGPSGILPPIILCTFGTCIIRPAASTRAMDVFTDKSGTASSAGSTIMFITAGTVSALLSLISENHLIALAALLIIAPITLALINLSLKGAIFIENN